MVKRISKRFIATLMALLLAFTLIPNVALAASISTGVSGLTADSDGGATWASSSGTITGSVKAKKTSGCTGDSFTAQNGTLTFTNESGATALLSFDYNLTLSSGEVEIDGTSITAGANFSKKLDADETVAVKITSNKANEEATTITISNIKLTAEANVNVTFKEPTHGSYTVDGATITTDTVKTVKTTDSVALAAVAENGYKFLGWRNETTDTYLSMSTPLTTSFIENTTITPEFVPNSVPVFQVGSRMFTDLNDAVSYAQTSNNSKIVLVSDGTLSAGDYTIPGGKTLLIPFDDAQSVFTTAPGLTVSSDGKPAAHVNPSAFRTLTMAKNAKITVANGGAISVPSMLSAVGTNSGSWNATPTGKHGRITMNAGSSIDVQSGGKLYVYGYISGSGNVYARASSEVWECFQIRCWRGGTATSGMADNSQKVFPLNQYYVQNIEAPVTYYPGATEKVFAAVNMSNQQFGASATFIGNGGMFQLTSGSMTKQFTGATDRLKLTVDGEFKINPMSLKITGLPVIGTLDLNTSDYVLPIQSNISIEVKSSNSTVAQNVAFLPGSELTIDDGATLTLASGYKAYIYDQDQWGAYAASGQQLVPVGYSTVNGTTTKRTAASLVDAKIDVNGTLNVGGSLYTTKSGAAIVSSQGTGKVVLQATPGTETNTYMATQSGSDIDYANIPITAAKLQNGDGNYYETADLSASTEIPYSKLQDKWGEKDPDVPTYTVEWLNTDGTPLEIDEGVKAGAKPEYNGEVPVKPTDDLDYNPNLIYTFAGWEDGEGNIYNEDTIISGDTSYTAFYTYEPRQITISFDANGGEGEMSDQIINAASSTKLKPNLFSREGYKFLGWSGNKNANEADYADEALFETDENTTLFAVWERETITVHFDANEGVGSMTPQAVSVNGGTLNANTFSREGYVFAGWNTKADGSGTSYEDEGVFSGDDDITLYAQWVIKTYIIRFVDDNGELIEEEQTVAHGSVPVAPSAPEKEADAQYTYSFAGWNKDIVAATEDTTYRATYSSTLRNYTITWKDDEGNVIDTTTVAYGETPNHADPVKDNTAEYTFTFKGWSPEISSVTGDATYTAEFTKTVNKYTVTFVSDTGAVIQSSEVEYGTVPTVPDDPTKASTAQYDYTFTGWDKEISPVTEDATYTAQFSETVRSYLVKFLNEDGTEAKSETLDYGSAIAAPGDPVKENTEEKVYSFLGWFTDGDPAVQWTDDVTVTGEVTYKAKFSETDQLYTVIWLDGDGSELQRKTDVLFNAIPEYDGDKMPSKEPNAQYTYSFADTWEQALDGDTFTYTLTPVFDSTVNTYTVTWSIDGEETKESYTYGDTPSHSTPEKEADAQYTYTFKGWSPEIEEVTGDKTYVAQFEKKVNSYTVTFTDEDGTILDNQTVAYGDTPVTEVTPVKADTITKTFEFAGWKPEISTVTGDVTYVATYSETKRTGWVSFDGKLYYVADGEVVTGIARVEYPDPVYGYIEDPEAVNDSLYLDEYAGKGTFIFGADGALQSDVNGIYRFDEADENSDYPTDWLADGSDVWVVNGEILWHPGEEKVGDDYYYFASANTMIKNKDYTVTRVKDLKSRGKYTFDADGKILMYDGITNIDGTDYYYVNGVKTYAGLIQVDDDYYYVKSDCTLVKNRSYYVSKTNDLLPAGKYEFDVDGKLILEIDDETKNGIVKETDDTWYYYVDGVKTYAGLFKIGDDYYYANSSGLVIHGRNYFVSKTNGIMDQGSYEFDDDGKMILKDTSKNGIVKETADTWYYYVDGVKTYAGLIQIDDDYYYVKTDCTVVHGRDYYVSKTNGLMAAGKFTFDEEGKMVQEHPSTTLDGIVKDGDTWTYYANGAKTYAGLIEIDGSYYYVKSDCTVVHGQDYYVSKTNGLISAGTYTFDEEGKMVLSSSEAVLDGIVKDGDTWTYYVNGAKTYAGLIEIDGDYYYVKSDCTVVHGRSYYVSKTNGLKEAGTYTFDEEGKMS